MTESGKKEELMKKRMMVRDIWSKTIQRKISKERALFIWPTINGHAFVEEEGGRVVSFGLYSGVVRYVLAEPMKTSELFESRK